MKRGLLLCALLVGAGCQYYRVTDPTNGKQYVTDNWHSGRSWNGAVEFTDLKSGDLVTLQNTELRPIPANEAQAEIHH